MYKNQLFYRYFAEWMYLYKNGAVRPITFSKYKTSLQSLKIIAPKVKLSDLDRQTYQKILNEYAKNHEKQTTMDFHRQLRASLEDALDEGIINTRSNTKSCS
ncbi:phage integrase SAM-like domain-containing protein [Bombilactobacillus thymidiniphilus]|uniref:Phage integrase SAM-like domain-containing protein n=1 Tax=Bombilactobacillus thymidiniphilus TaxID=2923363 RepID=A0ABY4PEX6_9LACO|nr:phage integrase SAM-like domain-containing protein [Bombilactobacillus thymidiniphilus]UQS84120.1 phage integrase SAM-like domain-containing protein [Bombilactobacillus thymidiniphilus]